MDLCTLAEKYGSDKCPKVYHTYTPAYNAILSPYRNTVKTMIEIGIGNPELMVPIVGNSYKAGASLRMWADYFENANIIGCDIREDVIFNEGRIKCYYLDQSSEKSLKDFSDLIHETFGKADIILDDGSHVEDHQILSFKVLWNLVKPGGFYIIEDIFTDPDVFKSLPTRFGISDCELTNICRCERSGAVFVCYRKIYDN